MYSKKQMGYPSGGYSITPPPGYDGSRFKSRSDGRDDAFPPYDKPARTYTAEKKPSDNNNTRSNTYDDDDVFSFDTPKAEKSNSIFPILKNGISNEELLIIALLIVLISENNISSELVLMLGLLLCL